jgi:hypothetical protein
MAGDDDDPVRVAGAALDGDDVADADAVRRAGAFEILFGGDDLEAAAAGGGIAAEFRLHPVLGGADAAPRVGHR